MYWAAARLFLGPCDFGMSALCRGLLPGVVWIAGPRPTPAHRAVGHDACQHQQSDCQSNEPDIAAQIRHDESTLLGLGDAVPSGARDLCSDNPPMRRPFRSRRGPTKLDCIVRPAMLPRMNRRKFGRFMSAAAALT